MLRIKFENALLLKLNYKKCSGRDRSNRKGQLQRSDLKKKKCRKLIEAEGSVYKLPHGGNALHRKTGWMIGKFGPARDLSLEEDGIMLRIDRSSSIL
jgi:hypothetical protein